jgi:hypothetical protein
VASLGTFAIQTDMTWRKGLDASEATTVHKMVKALSALNDVD